MAVGISTFARPAEILSHFGVCMSLRKSPPNLPRSPHCPTDIERWSLRGRGARGFRGELGRGYRVREEHRDRHRTDASGDRRDGLRLLLHRVEVDIADRAVTALRARIGDAVDAHVDDDGAFPDHVR